MRPSRFLFPLIAALSWRWEWRFRASAHPAPFSYLDIVFRNGGIEGTLVIHIIDVAHDLGIDAARTAAR